MNLPEITSIAASVIHSRDPKIKLHTSHVSDGEIINDL